MKFKRRHSANYTYYYTLFYESYRHTEFKFGTYVHFV